ncbi:hypothetical protein MAHJHV57_52050 [Mycobacterium avium subsp. hominissuis]
MTCVKVIVDTDRAADSHFGCVVRSFASMFPARRFGGGALAVYVDGQRPTAKPAGREHAGETANDATEV